MRRVPARLPHARRPARPVLRARRRGRPREVLQLRPLERLLRRPDREKAAQPFLPGSAVLSFGTAGCNLACKFCQNWDISKSREMDTLADRASSRGARRGRQRLGCPASPSRTTTRCFMEYAIDVAGAAASAASERRGHGRLHVRRAARGVLPAHGRRQHRPQGLHRGLLPQGLRRQLGAGARDARVRASRDAGLARGDNAADSREQ